MTRILLIDDDADFRSVLQLSLSGQGFDMVTAPDGVRGLQTVMDQPLDVILLDISMPHRDGMETLRLIRAVQASAKVIILTGYMTEAEQAEARRWGVADILFKPISTSDLVAAIGGEHG